MKPLGKIMIVGGILLAVFTLWRGLYYAPNNEDSGLTIVAGTSTRVMNADDDASLPARLIIPKLDIDAQVQALGVTKSGNMAAPNNFTDVSWYKFGTRPGNTGSAVMAAHVDNALGTPAVFYHLPDLVVGDRVFVVDDTGKRREFKVIKKALYRYDQAPAEDIFTNDSGRFLNLITCQGDWVPAAKSAENRLVIYTELVD